jgi:hypothetical protein
MTSVAQSGLVFLGLDVSKNAISVGVLPAGSDGMVVDRIFSDEESVRRLIGLSRIVGCFGFVMRRARPGSGWRACWAGLHGGVVSGGGGQHTTLTMPTPKTAGEQRKHPP